MRQFRSIRGFDFVSRACIVVLAVCACDAKPTARADPWATAASAPSAAPSTDPWGAAAAPTPAVDPQPASSGLPEGDWKCELVGTTWMNGQRYTQTMPVNGFAIRGSA
jgi:hypothetical protein